LNKEDFFISCFNSNKIGDDAAIVEEWIVSKDAFFENVHFKRKWLSLEEISYKSMIINLSDSVAMNARPMYALLAVALPSSLSRLDIKSLYKGFERAAKEFNVEIIGGDTVSNCKVDITVTVLAKSKKPLKRVGLKKKPWIPYLKMQVHEKIRVFSNLYYGKNLFQRHETIYRAEWIYQTGFLQTYLNSQRLIN